MADTTDSENAAAAAAAAEAAATEAQPPTFAQLFAVLIDAASSPPQQAALAAIAQMLDNMATTASQVVDAVSQLLSLQPTDTNGVPLPPGVAAPLWLRSVDAQGPVAPNARFFVSPDHETTGGFTPTELAEARAAQAERNNPTDDTSVEAAEPDPEPENVSEANVEVPEVIGE